MKVTITITKTLDDSWATPEQLKEMSDADIIELAKEDTFDFLDGACWSVERTVLDVPAFLLGAALVELSDAEFEARFGVTKADCRTKVDRLEELIYAVELGKPGYPELKLLKEELTAISQRGVE